MQSKQGCLPSSTMPSKWCWSTWNSQFPSMTIFHDPFLLTNNQHSRRRTIHIRSGKTWGSGGYNTRCEAYSLASLLQSYCTVASVKERGEDPHASFPSPLDSQRAALMHAQTQHAQASCSTWRVSCWCGKCARLIAKGEWPARKASKPVAEFAHAPPLVYLSVPLSSMTENI